jgi:hypothetical protein
LWGAAIPLAAQETDIGAAFRREGEKLAESCSSFSLRSLAGCAKVIATEKPVHVSAGSIAPQAGIGLGAAFGHSQNAGERWRFNISADAVRAFGGSWRAGGYLKAVLGPTGQFTVIDKPAVTSPVAIAPRPEINAYAQSTSLVEVPYFGIGPSTEDTNRSFFTFRQRIVGANALVPVFGASGLSLFGELNGRFVDVGGRLGADSPSIQELYSEADAPGLSTQPGVLQTGEGIRFNRTFGGLVTLHYGLTGQQFTSMSDERFSFRRTTVDLTHQIAVYRNQTGPSGGAPGDIAGPNESPASLQNHGLRATRNRYGTIELSFHLSTSHTGAGSVVPFYFQPTLGGSDLNGTRRLPSYDDYRFRAPNVLLLRAGLEHSLWGPIGFTASIDAGNVARRAGDLALSDLRHSYAAGLTLRAGGFPQFVLLYAWNGGSHAIADLTSTVLGGSARPSLY